MEDALNSTRQRRYYLDWLRVMLVLLVFLAHSAMPFNTARTWAIMNDQTAFAMTAWVGFCYQWGMQLFFLVAGASAGLSLRSRSGGEYLKSRTKRLMIPYVAGILTLIPVQAYFEKLHQGAFQGSFFRFYAECFQNVQFNWDLGFNLRVAHLWFLRYLFVCTLVTLPLFLWFRSERGRQRVARIAAILDKPGAVFLSALPIGLIQMALRAKYHDHADWTDYLCWTVFFVYGYLLVADPRVERAVMRHGLAALTLGVASFTTLGYLYQTGHVEPWETYPSYSLGCLLYELLRSVNTCAWVIFFLYLAIRCFNSGAAWLSYANEAVLPFYVLHHVVVILLAFYVVQGSGGVLVKYLLIILPSFVIIVSLYALLVRPVDVLRVLFGMSPKRRVLA